MSNKMKNRLGVLTDVLLIGGCVSVSIGVGLVNLSAGLIVAGALAIAGGVILGRGINT